MKRKTRVSELVQVGFVRLSAAFTIAALFMILGYIMWNGFFYSVRREYPVTSELSPAIERRDPHRQPRHQALGPSFRRAQESLYRRVHDLEKG